MNAVATSSERSSAATSASGPTPAAPRGEQASPSTDACPSESDFLKHEADEARAAILDALADLRGDVKTAADLRLWAQQHPWITVGVAAVAGVAVAGSLAATADRAANPHRREPPPERPLDRHRVEPVAAAETVAKHTSLMTMVADMLLALAKEAVGRFVATAIHPTAAAAARPPESRDAGSHAGSTVAPR